MNPVAAFRLMLAIAVAVLLIGTGYALGAVRGDARVQAANAKHAAVLADLADKAAKARDALAKYQRAVEDRTIAAGRRYEQGKRDAFDKGRAVERGILAGTVRLHERWSCPSRPAAGGVQVAGAAAEPDAAAADRAASAGRAVEAAAACDAQVIGLQEVVRAVYGLPGAAQ